MVKLARQVSGSGPPLVLVHGTSGDHASLRFVAPLLEERFTLIAVDRRGRRGSPDGENYAIEDEFDDVADVVDSLEQPTDLFGHSFGATVALGAAMRCRNLRRLVLYEPAPGFPSVTPEFLERLEALIDDGRREEALEATMREVGLGDEELAQFKASPVWEPRAAAAHTIVREVRAEERWVPGDLSSLRVPTLVLVGEDSPEWGKRGTQLVADALSDARVVTLEGQGHVATLTAPELVAQAVLAFLTE